METFSPSILPVLGYLHRSKDGGELHYDLTRVAHKLLQGKPIIMLNLDRINIEFGL
jgi:hypothetical protein